MEKIVQNNSFFYSLIVGTLHTQQQELSLKMNPELILSLAKE